VFAQ
jgi:hypothetical protein